ncbi:MAG TPA: CHRD domain-containing protein [Acidimicrobiia bacterium]|nr:CHRD domain-containing protein [Acidimicrobiia bacterium]
MKKGLRGALFAPLLGAVLVLGAPSATFAASDKPGDPPAAGSGQPGGAHSGHPDNPDPKDGHAAKPGDPGAKDPKAGDQPKDPKAGDQPKDPKAGDKDPKKDDHDSHSSDQHDSWYGHYDHDHYGYHGHHNWDTHRRYYRSGYRGPGWYDDCGYYGPNGYDGYYDSPDACDWQYGSQGESLRANLSGDQETPGPGAPNSVGTANLFVDTANGRLCYRLGYDGINRPSMAHIHRGGPGQTGEPVIDLHPEANGDEGCVGADPTVLRNLAEHPEAFYLNLHTPEYPDGAMRGQLFSTDRY